MLDVATQLGPKDYFTEFEFTSKDCTWCSEKDFFSNGLDQFEQDIRAEREILTCYCFWKDEEELEIFDVGTAMKCSNINSKYA
ncbi:hypothetical protein AVEN_192685-1, partial [Araneus ventricosus]